MHNIKRITLLFFLFFIFSSSWLFSRLITKAEVEKVTINWVKLENKLKHLRLDKIDVRISTIRELIYRNELIGYIVDLEPRGFILVPAVSELSPVKLISFSSNYEGIEKHPFIETLKYRLYFTATNLGYLGGYFLKTPDLLARKVDTNQKEKNEGVWKKLLSEDFLPEIYLYAVYINSVSPMLTSTWSQGNPYNMYTPEIDSQHCVTGCSATAQAQVMYYWKYPTTGQGVNSYYWENGSTYLSADFNHEYYWSRMIDNYTGSESEEQKDAVARLMSDVGISINMNYGLEGSSAVPNANNSLITFFMYCSDIRTVYRIDYLSWTDWFNVFKDQMDNGWPAILATYKQEGGHSVVIDGYRVEADTNQVHVNMGWGGYADNYYTIDDIYGYGDVDIDFAVINIFPPDCTNTGDISGKITDEIGNGLENVHVKIYDQNNDHVKSAWPDSNGNYIADCLNEGTYKIFFDTSQTGYYISEWYNDKDLFDTADLISVTVGTTTTGIDAVLELGGGIKGKVTNISGTGIKNVCVVVYRSSGSYVAYMFTNSSGDYEIKHLKTGSYKIYFDTTYASGDYASEWYNDKDSFDTADLVSVTAGGTTTGIDAELSYTTPTVIGVVKNSVGTGIEGVTITFSNEGGTATTDSSGGYLHSVNYGWSGTATPSKTHYTFDPPSRSYYNITSDQINQDYIASLVQYVLTIVAGTGGTTDPVPGTYSYDAGTEVAITATPDTHYDFSSWSGDVPQANENDNPITITMDYAKSITANFVKKQYTLTISTGTGGTTDPLPGSSTHDPETQVTIEAKPDSGYEFSGWSGDASGTTNPITITMDSDKSVIASFRAIAATDGEGAGKKGGCFIATAAYGSLLHPYVRVLRDFRDTYLMPGELGRLLVGFYYKYSPSVANFIAKHKALKVAVRISLLPLIAFSYVVLHLGPRIKAAALIFIFMLPVFLVWRYRRKLSRHKKKLSGHKKGQENE